MRPNVLVPRVALAVALSSLPVGCGGTAAPSPPTTAPTIPSPPPPPAESADARKFRADVAHYLAECRAGAKFLTLGPSLKEAEAKATAVRDLYAHLPEVPAEIDATGKVAELLKRAAGWFDFGAFDVKLRDEFLDLGRPEKVADMNRKLADLSGTIAADCAAVEKLVGRPK